MTQKSVAFGWLKDAEADAYFVSVRDGTATLTECTCYGEPRFYVGTKPMPPSKRHGPKKHRVLSTWESGAKEKAHA